MTDEDPWRAADGAVAPLRRYVRLALESDDTELSLRIGNARRMLVRALRRPLPAVVSARLDALAKEPDASDWLDHAAAELARIEVLAGLGASTPRPPREAKAERPQAPRAVAPQKQERRGPRPAAEPPAQPPKRRPEPEPDLDDGGDDGRDWGMSLRDAEVGAADVVEALEASGVVTVRDIALLRTVGAPTAAAVWPAGPHGPEGVAAYSGRLGAPHRVFSATSPPRAGAVLSSDAGALLVRWYGARPEPTGARSVVVGRRTGQVILDAELADADGSEVRLPSWAVPGVADAAIRGILRELAPVLQGLADPLPRQLLEGLRLPALGSALADAHVARSEPARRRLALEELLVAQLGVAAVADQRSRDRGIAHAISHAASARWGLERALDDAQQLVLEDLKRDLRRPVPTRRVLLGDAGAHHLALIAAATVAEGKTQVLFLLSSPAEAEQRFLAAEPFLRECGLVARVAPSPVGRAQADALKRGEVHVLFGTHDLLEQGLEFRRLGLVVASERPPYGRAVAAHEALAAPRPDLLVLPATAVGATVLLTAYADLRISTVGEGAPPPTVRTLRASQRSEAIAAVRAAVAAGRQALLLRPTPDDVDGLDLRDATAWVDALRAEGVADRVALLHGQHGREARVQTYDDVLHRRVDVLASTTLAEEGPPVGDVGVVLVEEAERLDRARLHRIAVAVAREQGSAEIVLLRGDEGAASLDLAPLDDPSDVHAGVKWPLPRLDWFEPRKDLALLLRGRDEAQRLAQADPQARRSPYWQEVAARWGHVFPGSEERGIVCPVREDAAGESKRRRRRRRRRR